MGKQSGNITVMSQNFSSTLFTLFGHTNGVNCLKILSDGRLASGSYDGTVRIWNLASGTLDMTFDTGGIVYTDSIDLLPNGYLISGSGNGIFVWNTATGSLVVNITDPNFGYITCIKTINCNYFVIGTKSRLVQVLFILLNGKYYIFILIRVNFI